MSGEQDTVLRLRSEADEVAPELRHGQVDDVLGQVFSRRARQRTQLARMWGAVAAVVFVMAGMVLVSERITGQREVQLAASIDKWPLRGGLAGDQALLTNAEQVWRAAGGPDGPVGRVWPLYAHRSDSLMRNMVLVVLSGYNSDGQSVVAFVTSPGVEGIPAKDRLFVRAVAYPESAPRAVGFVATQPDPSDTRIPDGGSIAFALAAPGTSEVTVKSSVVEHNRPEQGDTYWRIERRKVGAWNSVITTNLAGDQQQLLPAAGMQDPIVTPVVLSGSGDTVTARSTTKRPLRAGDLVMTPESFIGAVKGDSGLVDTSYDTWYGPKSVITVGDDGDGTLSAALFEEGRRVTYTSKAIPGVVGKVGKLGVGPNDLVLIERPTGTPATAVAISPR